MNFKTLDIHQLQILKAFTKGQNIFMSGPAGTGKSFLIKIIKEISFSTGRKCDVTALTGCAALLLDCQAKTLHSWCGVSEIKDDFNYHLRKVRSRKKVLQNWKSTNVLIIDEVSMMSARFFELLNYLGKKIRKNENPFGGIQLVFSGDFYQLPPVSKDKRNIDNCKFCFESSEWNTVFPKMYQLTKIFRQNNPIFTKILNEIRIGRIKRSTVRLLEERKIPYEKTSDIVPTILLPSRKTVDDINTHEHNKLSEVGSKIFRMETTMPTFYTENTSEQNVFTEIELFKGSNIYNEQLEIRIGDQVICTRNISESIVNGSRGIVVDIEEFPIVEFMNGNRQEIKPFDIPHESIKGLVFRQIPLHYAWALTIHKCQGMTLDLCIMDIGSNIFEYGQTYVALSRVKNLDGLYLTEFEPRKIMINPNVREFYESRAVSEPNLTKEELLNKKKKLRKFIKKWIEANKCEYKEPKTIESNKSHLETLRLFEEGLSISETSNQREINKIKVIDDIIKCMPHKSITYDKFMTDTEYKLIKDNLSLGTLVNIKDAIDDLDLLDIDITNEKIKICKKLHPELLPKTDKKIETFNENNYEINEELHKNLKAYRLKQSKLLECPAYHVYRNSVLDSLSKCPITSLNDFKKIKGIGEVFMEKYADDVLEIIQSV